MRGCVAFGIWCIMCAVGGLMFYVLATTPQQSFSLASHAATHTATPNIDATQFALIYDNQTAIATLQRNPPTLVPTSTQRPTQTPTARATATPTLETPIFATATTQAQSPTPATLNPIFQTATALWLPTPTIDTFTATPFALLYRTTLALWVLRQPGVNIVRRAKRGEIIEMTTETREAFGTTWRRTADGFWMDDRFLERVR